MYENMMKKTGKAGKKEGVDKPHSSLFMYTFPLRGSNIFLPTPESYFIVITLLFQVSALYDDVLHIELIEQQQTHSMGGINLNILFDAYNKRISQRICPFQQFRHE